MPRRRLNLSDKDEDPIESRSSEANTSEDMDYKALKQALIEEKEKAETYLANWQRAEADFSNFKKRTDQEKQEMGNFAKSVLILNILPIIDDLDRAFISIPPKLEKLEWVNGIRLIQRKLKGILEGQGLSEIECLGKCFDPSFHEAIAHLEGEEGIVIEEVQKGYELKDKVLRPSKVVVGKGNGTEEEKSKEPGEHQ
jgi:molecular chaperone GrpE